MHRRRGVPTSYGNVRFRSRHEAAFACLYDKLGWKWAYEPADLPGYLPDFEIKFARKPIFVEIKPAHEDIAVAKSKLEAANWDQDFAILIDAETKFVGQFYEPESGWDRAVLCHCMKCSKPTIVSESGRWACRNCDGGNRDLWWAYDAAAEWRAAKNLVQWRAA